MSTSVYIFEATKKAIISNRVAWLLNRGHVKEYWKNWWNGTTCKAEPKATTLNSRIWLLRYWDYYCQLTTYILKMKHPLTGWITTWFFHGLRNRCLDLAIQWLHMHIHIAPVKLVNLLTISYSKYLLVGRKEKGYELIQSTIRRQASVSGSVV